MKKWKVKPFTLFFILLTLLFLVIFPLWFQDRRLEPTKDPFAVEKPGWSGVITLWDTPYVRAGEGSHLRWLNNYITNFEKKYPGVFIDVRSMTTERLAMYLHGDQNRDILPDLISLAIYDQPVPEEHLVDLSHYFHQDELNDLREPALQRVQTKGKLIGVPWMMGSYGLYVNQDALINDEMDTTIPEKLDYVTLDSIARKATYEKKSSKRTIHYYGFGSYTDIHSRPLLSMIYQQDGKIKDNVPYSLLQHWMNEEQPVIPPNMINMPYPSAFRLFALDKRTSMLLGDSKVLFDLRNLQEGGKGVEFQLYSLPLVGGSGYYMDQIAAYALLKQSNKEKEQLCILFLKGLLQEEYQGRLANIGMFSVLKEMNLYEEDTEMKALQDSLDQIDSGPFGANEAPAEILWNSLTDEDS